MGRDASVLESILESVFHVLVSVEDSHQVALRAPFCGRVGFRPPSHWLLASLSSFFAKLEIFAVFLRMTLVCLALGWLQALPTKAQEDNQPPSGFRALFNGENLDGWHGMGHFDPRTLESMTDEERQAKRDADYQDLLMHWKVENGELVNDGHGVYATTDEKFGDMEFWLDYRIAPKADSGIYLRTTPQVQIWDFTDPEKFRHNADKGSGGLWNNSPGAPGKDPLVLADNPIGEWNRVRIIQVGPVTSVWLNGKMVVDRANMENFWDRSRPLFPTGMIQLQTHGGETSWRNIFVREIPAEEANQYLRGDEKEAGFESIFNGKDLTGWAGATENYEVRDGAIVCKPGKGGTLHTADEYADFVSRVEFRLPPGGNNGLAIRYPGEGDPAYTAMCELQVLDDDHPRYSQLDPRQYHGSAYGKVPAKRGYLRPAGEWNYQETTVKGSRIRVDLNGYTILDADLSEVTEVMGNREHEGKDRTSGTFGFAGHSDPVEFRNVSMQRLGSSEVK
jgi:hypothetical protein